MNSSADAGSGPDEGPGRRLQHAREQRELTAQQVAEQLNLDVAVIAAIERNDFPALGAPVFARGHLRRYAGLVGLSDHDVLVEYDRARQPGDPTLIPLSHIDRLPERQAARWPWITGGVLAFGLAATVVWYLSEFGFALPQRDRSSAADSAASDSPAGSLDSATVRTTTSSTAAPAATTDAPARERSPAGATTPDASDSTATTAPGVATAGPPGSVTLVFDFAQDSWLEIFDGTGKAVLYDLGPAGSRRTISAMPPLNVTVGNAPAVRLTVNGKAARLPAPEAGQTVVRVRVDSAGALR
jgi:cytoskeleton protein RodZ